MNQAKSWLITADQTYSLMQEKQLKAFIAKDQDDSSLQWQLKDAANSDADDTTSKEAGFIISADELKNV